jgi:hypothetical protein
LYRGRAKELKYDIQSHKDQFDEYYINDNGVIKVRKR